jgi:transposase
MKIIEEIKSRLSNSCWKDLRQELEKKGWKLPDPQQKSTSSKLESKKESEKAQSGSFPGQISAYIIDPKLLN